MSTSILPENAVAVIGMCGRFPGASSIDELWSNLCDGKESISRFSLSEIDPSIPETERHDPDYVPARGILDSAHLFDAAFFGISPLEARLMDPQQRLFLETCWTALEDAACAPSKYDGMVGVYAGMANNTYFQSSVQHESELVQKFGPFQTMLANEKDFLATRVSHKLNLTGPSISMYTGCSTSLVAISSAFHSLLGYECDVALAGGACITCPQNSGYTFSDGGIQAVDGHCRPFDAKASGTVFSNGVAVVVLKRLEDAVADGDHVHAIVRGAATNNDGAAKVSFAAPSVQGQAEVISMALAQADVEPATISFVEAHGTATLLGDPIEFEGLRQAFQYPSCGLQYCALGSVKGNFGHLLAAAGVTGFIKSVLALEHARLPPTINHHSINPQIDLGQSPFFINTDVLSLESNATPLRAGVSSFGIGGTNAHVILEAAPGTDNESDTDSEGSTRIFVVSAKTEEALDRYVDAASASLSGPDTEHFGSASFVMANAREEFQHRTYVVARDSASCAAKLSDGPPARAAISDDPDVIFVLPGLGTQYPRFGMGLLGVSGEFRDQVRSVTNAYNTVTGKSLDEAALLESGDQFSLFAVEYALARLMILASSPPRALIGCSTGELAAASIARVMSLEDAMRLMVARDSLLRSVAPQGAMLAVSQSADAVEPGLPEGVYIAGQYSPKMSVVSGTTREIGQLEMELKSRGINSMRLPMQTALHSPLLKIDDPGLLEACSAMSLAKPRIPMVSTVTGHWMNPAQVTDPTYWASHQSEPVLFHKALEKAVSGARVLVVEIGPGNSLSTATHQVLAGDTMLGAIPTSPVEWKGEDYEAEFFLNSIGQMWTYGVRFSWGTFWPDHEKRAVKMPTYPFTRKSYWLDAKSKAIG